MPITTGFTALGTDIGANVNLVPKSYLIDRYPELASTFKQAGLWGWGNNTNGQLGVNDTSNRSSPVQTVSGETNWKLVACGVRFTAAIKTDGTLWTWGYNINGQLGVNDTTNRSSPVQTVAGGTNWKQVVCGRWHTTTIKTDGTLWLWGHNNNGQLGVNDITHRSSPVQTVAGGTNWKLVAGGEYHTAAIKTDGALWLWGLNTFGQIAINDITHRSSPVQTVAGGTNWKLVSCGRSHTAAIKTDGTLWSWGQNSDGQLGNYTTSQSSPIQTISGGTNWKLVSCGRQHTAAIKTDGTLWSWGANSKATLGTNDLVSASSPVQTVSAGTNWKLVAGGTYNTAAIKTDGTLWSWGQNDNGLLGTNDTTHRSSPVQTVSAGTNWKLVACGHYHTAAIRDDSADPI